MQNQDGMASGEYDGNGVGSDKRPEQNSSTMPSTGKIFQLQDLKAMKAKVVASINRARDRNSQTPTVEPSSGAKPGPAMAAEAKAQDSNLEAQSMAEITGKSNDFHMHVDDLLAEGKAAAEADRRSSNGSLLGIEQVQVRLPVQTSKSPTAEHHEHSLTKTTSTSTITGSPIETRISGSGHNRESSGPSELGEIVEEKERRRTSGPKLVDQEKGESSRASTNAGEPAVQEKRIESTPLKNVERTPKPSKAVERTDSIRSKAADDKLKPKRDQLETPKKLDEQTRRAEPQDRVDSSNERHKEAPRNESRTYRKEYATNAGREEISSRAQYTSEETTSRPKEGRSHSDITPHRNNSNGSVVATSRDIYTRRPSSELVKEYTPRREVVSHRLIEEPISRRVIEIDDDEEYRRPAAAPASREHRETTSRAPREHQDMNIRASHEYQEVATRAPREYQEVATRRYVEEPVSKGVIHLSDVYWNDLEEWLEMTGYHDRNYRKQALYRQRELQALEAKRAALTREAQLAQEERAYLARAQSMQPREVTVRVPRAATEVRTIRASSVFEMPPPPVPAREEREVIRRTDRDVDSPVSVRTKSGYSTATAQGDESGSRARYVEQQPVEYAESGSLKRRYRTEDEELERKSSDKYVRVDSNSRSHASTQGDGEVVERPAKARSGNEQPEPQRARARHDVSESRLAYDLARLTGDDEATQRHKEPTTSRGRAASSAASAQRDRARSASPAATRRAVPSPHRPDEDRPKGHKGDGPPRGPDGYSQEVHYSNRKLQGGNSSKGNSSQNFSWNEQQQQHRDEGFDDRTNENGKGNNHNNNYDNQQRSEGWGHYNNHNNHQNHQNNNHHHNHPYQQSGRGRGRGRGRGYHSNNNNNHQNHHNNNNNHNHQNNHNNRMDRGGFHQADRSPRNVQPNQMGGSQSLELHRGGQF